jgi:hypothetical protein
VTSVPPSAAHTANSESGKFATRSTWRAQTMVEVEDMRTQLRWLLAQTGETAESLALANAVQSKLGRAEKIAVTRRSFKQLITGANVLAARQYLDAATIDLLRLAPLEQVASLLPNLYAQAAESLPSNDVRLPALAKFLASTESSEKSLTESDRFAVIAAFQGAQQQGQREKRRIRNFRDVIVGVSLFVGSLALLAGFSVFLNRISFPSALRVSQA